MAHELGYKRIVVARERPLPEIAYAGPDQMAHQTRDLKYSYGLHLRLLRPVPVHGLGSTTAAG